MTEPKCADPIDSSLPTTECTPDVINQGVSALKSAADSVGGLLGKLGIDANIPTFDANTVFMCMKSVKQGTYVAMNLSEIEEFPLAKVCTVAQIPGPIDKSINMQS